MRIWFSTSSFVRVWEQYVTAQQVEAFWQKIAGLCPRKIKSTDPNLEHAIGRDGHLDQSRAWDLGQRFPAREIIQESPRILND